MVIKMKMTNEEAIHFLMNIVHYVEYIDGHICVRAPLMDASLLAIKALLAQRCGHWIDSYFNIACSECKTEYSDEIIFMNRDFEHSDLNYCPNCGARMTKEN